MIWYLSAQVHQAEQIHQPIVIRIKISIFIRFQFRIPQSMYKIRFFICCIIVGGGYVDTTSPIECLSFLKPPACRINQAL